MKIIKNKLPGRFLNRLAIIITMLLYSNLLLAQEICNNGIDDDGNGQIDLNDTACHCNFLSLIPNPSFENMTCCPSTYSQVNCSLNWVQATDATSDYMNTCGFVFGAATAAGLVPFPDGNGIVGSIFAPTWQEYVGTCLSSPLLKDSVYSLQMSVASTPIDGSGNPCNGGVINYGPIDITIWGAPNCSNLPNSGTTICPSAPWMVIGSVNYNPTNVWGTITISMTPTVNINAIAIGSPCTLPPDYTYGPCYPYFYFDKLILTKPVIGQGPPAITQTGSWCTNNIVLTSQTYTGTTYQWYHNGISISGATTPTLSVSANSLPAGMYQLVTTTSGSLSCSEDYSEVFATPVASAGSDTTVCVGGTINLSGHNSSLAGGTVYQWSGPNAFSSTQLDPSITNAQQSVAGDYILIATNSSGCSSSDTVHVTVNTCGASIYQSQYFNQLAIYPNPGNGQITISNSQIITEIKIVNALGQIIQESTPKAFKANLAIETPGVYFVMIKSGTHAVTKKLIVN